MADAAERGITVLVSSHNLWELEDVCDHVGILDHGRLLLERSLSELQENMVKVQLALREEKPLPQGLELVHESVSGRLHTLILRGNSNEILTRLQELEPLYMDALPLSLEEVFIYELGGNDYAVKDILQTSTPKIGQQQDKSIDKVAGQDYNAKETQPVRDALPVTKTEINGPEAVAEPSERNPDLYGNDGPVLKADLSPEKETLSSTFNDLTNRMNNLYNDEEEEENR